MKNSICNNKSNFNRRENVWKYSKKRGKREKVERETNKTHAYGCVNFCRKHLHWIRFDNKNISTWIDIQQTDFSAKKKKIINFTKKNYKFYWLTICYKGLGHSIRFRCKDSLQFSKYWYIHWSNKSMTYFNTSNLWISKNYFFFL